MIKSVVREYQWAFSIIEKMYLDDEDYKGLEYWHNDVIEMEAKIKK